MTFRDMKWRAAGAALYSGGCAASLLYRDSALVLLCFIATIFGMVLMLQGKRVATLWRAVRSGHGDTVAVIHARRVQRRRPE